MRTLDLRAGASALALLLVTTFLIVRGDNIGVQIIRVTPTDVVGQSSVIAVQFSEPMDRTSVTTRFRSTPPIPGEITWTGARLLFRPTARLEPGQTYIVEVAAGATSESGRQLLATHRFTFRVFPPRIAYLAPADGPIKDVWVRDAAAESPPERLTSSSRGIVAFDVSADGGRIVFAERKDGGGATDLHLLDLDSRATRAVTNCGEFICTNPVWSPDGTRIAYERLASSTFEPGLATTSTRVWLLEPDSPRTNPLFGDTQTPPNYKPRWSPDGQRIAVSQLPTAGSRNPGIVVVGLTDNATQFFPTNFSSMGVFAPDGERLAFPNFAVQDGEVRTVLQVASLKTGDVTSVPGLTQAHEAVAEWQPNTAVLAVARRSTPTEQSLGRQLYLLDPTSGSYLSLVRDPAYDHAAFFWDPAGKYLAVQRGQVWTGGPELTPDQRTQIWTFDTTTGAGTLVAMNAYAPQWVP